MSLDIPHARAAGVVILTVFRAFGQVAASPSPPSTPPTFEVATIKTTPPDFREMLIDFPGGRFSVKGFTLRDLIAYAYDVDGRQVMGLPKWSVSERYDVVGKPEKAGPPNTPEIRLMVQALLAERFQLEIHRDSRDMAVYVMTIAKGGVKMTPRTEGDGGAAERWLFQPGKLPAQNITVQQLAYGLQTIVLDRPVVDKTGLTGKFDFVLSWSQEGPGGAQLGDPNAPDIFTAMQEQLGLRLESQTLPRRSLSWTGPRSRQRTDSPEAAFIAAGALMLIGSIGAGIFIQ